VDLWATWDPFLAAVQLQSNAKIIADGEFSGVSYTRFYPIASKFLKDNPQVAKIVADELIRIGSGVKANPDEAAKIHAPLVGLAEEVIRLANSRRSYAVAPVDKAAIAGQQKIADVFAGQKLLTKPVVVGDVPVWGGR
jgi:sulfonate transport system substrate-binding protein